MEYNTQLLVIMISYISLLMLWGVYQGRKVKNSSDFAIADYIAQKHGDSSK